MKYFNDIYANWFVKGCSIISNIFSRYSSNVEAFASEILKKPFPVSVVRHARKEVYIV